MSSDRDDLRVAAAVLDALGKHADELAQHCVPAKLAVLAFVQNVFERANGTTK